MSRYSYIVRWSDEDSAFIATCPEFPGVSAFGDTQSDACAEIEVALEAMIETYREEGWDLPEPAKRVEHSGQFRLRLPRSLHAKLAEAAETEGVSLNTLASTLIASGLGARTVEDRTAAAIKQLRRSLSAMHVQRADLHAEAATGMDYQDPILRRVYSATHAQTQKFWNSEK